MESNIRRTPFHFWAWDVEMIYGNKEPDSLVANSRASASKMANGAPKHKRWKTPIGRQPICLIPNHKLEPAEGDKSVETLPILG